MKVHEKLEQGSEEWRRVRAGKLTASNAQAIGTNGKGLETLVYETLAEKHSANPGGRGFSNVHTEAGKELEETARSMYELERKVKTEQVGFIERDEYSGCSPDSLIGDDGGAEFKCPDDTKHFELMVDGLEAVDTKYTWQVQMNLLVTGRKWWDLVFYNPNFKNRLIVFRIEPDAVAQEKLLLGLAKGTEMLKAVEARMPQA